MTPGGDGEPLRDAIAAKFYEREGDLGDEWLPWSELPDEGRWGKDFFRAEADVAIAALRTVLREHPDAIAEFGWTCSPDGYFPPIALGGEVQE